MKRSNKKGFTIVELVIVIAVIAILAAVLIPTFAGLIQKANESKDTQLVKNLNTALAADNKEHKTMTDALDAAAAFGYDVGKINASATGNEILWDSENDVFCYLKGENVEYIPETNLKSGSKPDDYKFWKIYDKASDVPATQKYSIYWNSNADFTAPLTVGFDAGNNTAITALTYTGVGTAQKVVIRTNGGSLKINDTNNASHQIHYGTAANVTIATGTNCYEGHAIVGAMTITQGHAIADNGAYIGVVKAVAGVTLEEANNGVFVIPTNVEASAIPASVAEQIGYINDGNTITAKPEKNEQSYFYIDSKEKLYSFASAINTGVEIPYAKFTENIELDVSDREWDPIGNWQYPYHGTIDGMGCKIKGITQTANATKSIWSTGNSTGYGKVFGFIGIAGCGDVTISNINFTDVNISLSDIGKNVGTLIGYVPANEDFADADKGGSFWTRDDSLVTNTVRKVTESMGADKVTIKNIITSGSVSGNNHVGGLIGKIYTDGDIYIENCTNNCTVTGKGGYVGGIVGIQSSQASSFIVKNCHNTATIKADPNPHGVAGLVGRVNDEHNNVLVFVMDGCTNTGSVVYGSGAGIHNDLYNVNACKSHTIK